MRRIVLLLLLLVAGGAYGTTKIYINYTDVTGTAVEGAIIVASPIRTNNVDTSATVSSLVGGPSGTEVRSANTDSLGHAYLDLIPSLKYIDTCFYNITVSRGGVVTHTIDKLFIPAQADSINLADSLAGR